jgi:hypothetical protein
MVSAHDVQLNSARRSLTGTYAAAFASAAAVAIAGAILSTASAAAPRRVHVVQGDRSVGGIVLVRTTAPQAAVRLVQDGARRVRKRPNSCLVTWPRIGLTVDFGTLGSDPTNPCKGGVAFTATVTNRAAWRTALGLRIGDTTARLRALYPRASLHRRLVGQTGYWLVTRRACATVGGFAYPGLLARIRGGRVSALVATVGICE